MKKIFTVLLLLTVSTLVLSQHKRPNTLLWKISGNGLKNPSYLYGTIHSIEIRNFYVSDVMLSAFYECNVLATENASFTRYISVDAYNKIDKRFYLPKGKKVSDFVNEEDFRKIATYMQDTIRLSKKQCKTYLQLKPMYLSGALNQHTHNIRNTTGYELYFWKLAMQRNKNKARRPMLITGLEEYKHTLAVLDSISIEEQVVELLQDIHTRYAMYPAMIRAYRQQNRTDLYQMSTSSQNERVQVMHLKNRNLRWLYAIEKNIHTQPTFIAVGAAHLDGEFGLLNLLEALGYTVSPLFNKSLAPSSHSNSLY